MSNIAAVDIKQALYAILGKKKIGKPNYQFLHENNRTTGGRYRCQCTVNGLDYIGYGCSRNKKDAQTNAARDYGEYLLREGLVTPAELPQLQLQPSDLTMAPSQPVEVPGIEQPTSSLPYHSEGQPPHQELLEDFASDRQKQSRFYVKPQIPLSAHDLYVEQKADQVAQSEAVDMTAEIHGGWTLENCKQALNEYCQKKRLPPRDYKISKTGTDQASTVVAENELFLPHLNSNRLIYGRGQGSNQKMAITSCALSIVRQLFHIGDIPPISGVQAARSQKQTADNLSEIKVKVEPHLTTRIEQYLTTVGVQPALDGIDSSSPQNPCSLLIDHKLAEFTVAEQDAFSSTIIWAPPSQNWNVWKASNIDDQPIAFWSMEKICTILLNSENAKLIPERIFQARRSLPVFQHREEIIRSIAQNPVVLIKGATGCGKSTQICQYLLESHVLDKRGAYFNCYITQPRRISAITLAERIAVERDEQLGESVGYSVRFEGCTPRPYGAIMFVTVGVLMRKMEIGLRGISHVIIDEIHERDINTDFILIVIRDMIRAHPKLRVVLMSATIDTSMFTEYFGQCPIIEIQQRVHPVQHFFLEDTIGMLKYMPSIPVELGKKKKKRKKTAENNEGGAKGEDEEEVAGENSMTLTENLMVCADTYHPMVKQALDRLNERAIPIELIEILLTDIDKNGKNGAVLIFLPGWSMISLLWNRLMLHPIFHNTRFVILPLHSQLSAREQHRVFEPVGADQRKIILSTNIAETSVTIDDVVFVIDSCRVREKMYTSRNNLVHFANVWASRTNLVQRRGRAGRVQEGFCFHLVTKARFEALEEHRTPEMLRTPLHEITLTIKLLRLGSVGSFLEKAVQSPPVDAVVEAEVLLREMNALDKNLELTDLGRILARLPIEPKLGKMVLLGAALGIGDLMLTAAAATSFNSPFVPKEKMHTKLSHLHRSFSGNRPSDHIGLVNCIQQFEQELEIDESAIDTFCRRYSLSYPLLNMTREAKRQLYEVLTKICSFPDSAFISYPVDVYGADPKLDLFLSLLVAAYYPNVCYIRDRRRVFTLERTVALLSNMSVCVPFNRNEQPVFPSPLFMFTEKVKVLNESHYVQSSKPSWIDEFADFSLLSKFQLRTSCISCKQCSMISPLQLLLFGSRRVDAIGSNKVQLDKMIPLEMSAKLAAQIVALRPCLDALIVRTCTHPEQLAEQSENDKILVELICELSSEKGWLPTGEEGSAPIEGISGTQSSKPKMEYRYNAAEQNSYTLAQRSELFLQPYIHPGRSPRKRLYDAPPLIPGFPSPVYGGYGDRPMPILMPPNPTGTEAIAAATGLAEMAAVANEVPFNQRDFSTMAGFGSSNYFGSGRPEAMIPQQRHLHRNGGPVFQQGTFPKESKRGGRGRGKGGGRGRPSW